MGDKSIIAVVTGFFAHHAVDLEAIDAALSGVLHALPVNQETRETIQNAIDRVRDSAANIGVAVERLGASISGDGAGGAVIRESDIQHSLAAVLPAALDAYFRDHPVQAPGAPDPVVTDTTRNATLTGTETRTAEASDETKRSQAGETGSGEPGAAAFGGDTTVSE